MTASRKVPEAKKEERRKRERKKKEGKKLRGEGKKKKTRPTLISSVRDINNLRWVKLTLNDSK